MYVQDILNVALKNTERASMLWKLCRIIKTQKSIRREVWSRIHFFDRSVLVRSHVWFGSLDRSCAVDFRSRTVVRVSVHTSTVLHP